MQEYCTLEPISRKLTLTEPQRIAGVESDENVRGLKFKFPKIVDGTDFTQMQLRINFINSRQEKGQHIVTDLKPLEGEEGYITFTWPFSRLVTRYRGYTKFIICAVKTDENGTITAEWNTALAQMRVLEGLEVEDPEISPEEKDVIAQLISICQDSADEAAQSAQQAQEEAEKVLTYGPTIGENGNWYLKGEDTGLPSRGEKGEQGIPGAKGETGASGKDGSAPEIGANGNWYIDGKDTGKPSRGEKGETGDRGETGAAGENGITPTIGANGNWFLGEDDTGKPSRGTSGELLLAEYVHQGNQEIYFSSFDWDTGIGECTEPHGLTKTVKIIVVPNDWWISDFKQRGLCIPFEWCLYKGELSVIVVDETHLKVVGSSEEEILINSNDPLNVNLDCTQFHFEIGTPFEITNFPVKPTSIRVTISGFIRNSYRYLYAGTVMNDEAKLQAAYNKLLTVPIFGIVSKPNNALYQLFDMTVDLNGRWMVPFKMDNKILGRRASGNTNKFLLEEVREESLNVWVPDDLIMTHGIYKYIYSLRCSSDAYAVYSNHSVIKVYARTVMDE